MLSFVNAALFYELICPLLRFKSGGVRAPATASSQMMEVEEGIYIYGFITSKYKSWYLY